MVLTTESPRVRFDAPAGPDLLRAASLGLAVARYTKCGTWDELTDRITAGEERTLRLLADIDLTPEDAHLLTSHTPVLRLLAVRPLLTVAVCPDCHGWVLAADSVSARCLTSRGCSGKPVKGSIAKTIKPPKTTTTTGAA